MIRRLFAGLAGLALSLTLVGYLASKFTIVAVGATPLPSGCYTDGFGLAVCGPNYPGPYGPPGGGTIIAGQCISVTPTATPTGAAVIANTCTPTPAPSITAIPTACAAGPAGGSFSVTIPICSPSPIPNGDIMANISGISAIPAPSTGSAILDALFSSTQGSILYRGASLWAALGPGTAGQILASGGAGANPLWTAAPSFTQATPSPTASNCIGITGSFPYTVAYTCATPTAGAAGVAMLTPSPSPSPWQTLAPPANNTGYLAVSGGMQSIAWLDSAADGVGGVWGFSTNIQGLGNCEYFCLFNSRTGTSPVAQFAQENSDNSDILFLGGLPGQTTNQGVLGLNWNSSGNVTYISANQGTGGLICWNNQFSAAGSVDFRVCHNSSANPDFAFDSGGRLHVAEVAYSSGVVAQPSPAATGVAAPAAGDVWASESNTTGRWCTGGNSGTSPTSACGDWNITKASAFSVSQPIWATSSKNKGQVSCTLSALTCTATATVVSGATCSASYDTTATTVTLALLLPLSVSVSTTTLTVSMQGAATATGTAAADYTCL